MIITDNTHDRILKAIENGAKLVLYKSACPEFGTVVEKITLRKGDNELRLDHAHRYDDEVIYHWKRETITRLHDGIVSAEVVAWSIIDHPEIKEDYAGYVHGRAPRFRSVYVHRNQPAPRWVSEQWETPVSRYGMAYD